MEFVFKKDKMPATANSGIATSTTPEFPLGRVINQLKIQGKLQRVIIREQRPIGRQLELHLLGEVPKLWA